MPRAPGHASWSPKSADPQHPRRQARTISRMSSTVAQKVAKARSRCSTPTASRCSNSTKAPADRWCSTSTSMSSRARIGVAMKPPASEKEKPEVLADQPRKLAEALKKLTLAREQERAADQRDLADDHAGKHRAPEQRRSRKARATAASRIPAGSPPARRAQRSSAWRSRRPAPRSRPPSPRPGFPSLRRCPRASTRPSQRQISFGRKPTRTSTNIGPHLGGDHAHRVASRTRWAR